MVNVRFKSAYFTKKAIFRLCLMAYYPLLWAVAVLATRKFVDYNSIIGKIGCYKFALPFEVAAFSLPSTLITGKQTNA